MSEVCGVCKAGEFCPEGSAVPQLCPPGTFSNETGAADNSTCTPCAPGSYTEHHGAAECDLCLPGYYSNATGAASEDTCVACAPGTFTNDE